MKQVKSPFLALAADVQSSLAVIQLHLRSCHTLQPPSVYLQEVLISDILFQSSL